MHLEDTRRIPPPDPDREPLKVNVYERMSKAAAQLTPLFPYDSAGAIIPAGAVLVGGPDMEYGHFFHWNTVNEVAVTYGASKAMLAAGQIFVTQQLHGVNSFLRDQKDPDAFAVMVITQHQSASGDQKEALIARCAKCKAELVRTEYDATPHGLPGYDAKRYGTDEDPVRVGQAVPELVVLAPQGDSDQAAAFAASAGARWAELAGADSAPSLLRDLLGS